MQSRNQKNRQEEILETIGQMRKTGENISFYSVAKKTGASKSYLYRNELIANTIDKYRKIHSNSRTEDSKDVLIKALQNKVLKLQEENKQLKEQLKMREFL